jgi:hypothetical protein
VLAVLVHLLLIVAIAFGVKWRAHEPEGVSAELWSAVPQIAAPRAVSPPPTPDTAPAPEAEAAGTGAEGGARTAAGRRCADRDREGQA